EEPGALLVEVLRLAVTDVARGRDIEALREIRPGTERFAFRGKHDRATLRIAVERIERLGDVADERVVEIIVGRAANLDGGDGAHEAPPNGSILRCNIHGKLPVTSVVSIVWLPLKIKRCAAAWRARGHCRGSHHCAGRYAGPAGGSAGARHRTFCVGRPILFSPPPPPSQS